jgi:SAM-dependent methyltransferase
MANRRGFAHRYRIGGWDGLGSGPGSTPDYTAGYRAVLEDFLRANTIRSVIDVGCGDWQFSQLIDWQEADYIGYEVVPTLVEENRQRFARPNVRFLDMPEDYDDIATADLALCKDVLQHLSLAHAEQLLSVLERRAKYVLITNCVHTDGDLNGEIEDGYWRPLDISLPPFSRRASDLTTFHTKKAQLLVHSSN